MSTPATLVSSDGSLNPSCLRSLPAADPDECLSIVSVLGAHGVNQSELLNDLFNTTFSSSQPSISHTTIFGHDSAIMAEPPRHLSLLHVEPYIGTGTARDDVRDMSWTLSLSLSNVVLFLVRMPDLVRPQCNGMDGLRGALSQMLLLQADNLVPGMATMSSSDKRALLVVVRDYEADVVSRDEIVAGVLSEMQNVYAMVAKPPRCPSRISDLFEFEFALLPSKQLQPDAYEGAKELLQQRLLNATSDDYLFERGAYAIPVVAANDNGNNTTASSSPTVTTTASEVKLAYSPADVADAVWRRMEKDRTQDVPPKKDLMSTFDCDSAMRNVFDAYQRNVRVWKRETDGGVIIEQFGTHASKMMKDTLAAFEQEASPHKGSKAFKRKRDELKDLLDADLYNLFVIQIAKLREVTYRAFKDRLDSFDEGDDKLDRSVNTSLKEAQKSFRSNAQALRPQNTSWRYDNDEQELAGKMREDATDKLQRARIAEYQEGGGGRRNRRRAAAIAASAAPKRRQPISLGIHYLDPAPFGFKDSRFDKLNEDDSVQYQPSSSIFGNNNRSGGLSVPVAPGRDTNWSRANQDLIFTDRK